MGEEEAIEILKSHGMTQEEAEDFIAGTKRGIEAFHEGKKIPWDKVKMELGLDQQDNKAPEVYCQKDAKMVPIWHCLGSFTQGREVCSYVAKATVYGAKWAEVECEWRP